MLFELVYYTSDRRGFLANVNVNALNHRVFLVNDRINSNRRFARLAVSNNELALAATNGDHAVDRLEARLHWLINRLSTDDARRYFFYGL